MRSRSVQPRGARSARRLPEIELDKLLDSDGTLAADAAEDALYVPEDDEYLVQLRAERRSRGRSSDDEWLAARIEADDQPEWRDVFSEIDESFQ